MAGDYMSDEPRFITVDDKEIIITDDMIFGGSYSCTSCNAPSREAIMIAGTLYWVCPNGHDCEVVLYE